MSNSRLKSIQYNFLPYINPKGICRSRSRHNQAYGIDAAIVFEASKTNSAERDEEKRRYALNKNPIHEASLEDGTVGSITNQTFVRTRILLEELP